MSIDSRVTKLEQGFANQGGRCECSGRAQIRHYREGDKEIEADKSEFTPTCPDCGSERELLQIIVVPPKLSREDWGEYAAAQMSR
jgi:hypothetical protein